MEITERLARNLLSEIDKGLCEGVGNGLPGHMNVLQALTFYMGGETSGGKPRGVSRALCAFIIGLNDARRSSNKARAKGMRRIAISVLGTETMNHELFVEKLERITITWLLPKVIRIAAALHKKPHKNLLLEAASRCETEGTAEAAMAAGAVAEEASRASAADARYAAYKASEAAYVAGNAKKADKEKGVVAARARTVAFAAAMSADAAYGAANFVEAAADQLLVEFSEEVVKILIELGTPGSKFLFVTE